ncbi:MAG: hypothetical protein CEN90_672 [Parcubacteria group bacterium Licking1014_17]|nr:MAG: hypothetical protein CEN90_672 [Parcubacteria group bacterium Licking1014_17]
MKTKRSAKENKIEIGALLEDFNDKFDLLAEQTSQIPLIKDKVVKIEGKVDDLNGKFDLLAEDMGIVKTDLEFIKTSLKRKVDIDEFSALERRVITLENRIK